MVLIIGTIGTIRGRLAWPLEIDRSPIRIMINVKLRGGWCEVCMSWGVDEHLEEEQDVVQAL